MKKESIIQIIIIILLTIILGVLIHLSIKEINNKKETNGQEKERFEIREENKEKETKEDDVEKGTEVSEKEINLNEYNSNITITESGRYTITGKFKHSILIEADDDVTLVLNNVTIENEKTATISNISENNLTIELEKNTVNKLSDGGSSEYDSCIYSKGNLIIEGEGTLNVYGNQEEGEGIATETKDITINSGTINIESEDDGINAGGDGGTITINGGKIYIKANGDGIDSNKNLIINGGEIYTIGSPTGGDAGIDTDGGFEINGGEVIALGSDMLEKPENTSIQKFVCFSLKTKINKGTTVTLKNEDDIDIIEFKADEEFKTLILSNEKIRKGTYYLYENGEDRIYIRSKIKLYG